MVDPLHFPSLSSLHSFLSLPPDNSYVRMRRLVLLEHVSNLFRAIPFMTIDDDYPIFLIVPAVLTRLLKCPDAFNIIYIR